MREEGGKTTQTHVQKLLTIVCVAELSANHLCPNAAPALRAEGPPLVAQAHLHPPLILAVPIDQPQGASVAHQTGVFGNRGKMEGKDGMG